MEVYISCYEGGTRNKIRISWSSGPKLQIFPMNHACEVTSDFRSPSAAPWTWAAYCKFQSTSSTEGRKEASGDKHLAAMEITRDRDSCKLVASTIGSNTWSASSLSVSDVICKIGFLFQLDLLIHYTLLYECFCLQK
jgi:hypothetical protein